MRSVRLFLLFALNLVYSSARIIELPNGKLKGEVVENYYSYTNIRYAEPAVRFEPSKPYETIWDGVRNATGEMLRCVQFEKRSNVSNGQEDCLFLNVFTSRRATNKKLLPVFAYLNSGAFMFGGAGWYSPKVIMAQGSMVVVLINYRLGPLGFLTTKDHLIPGNIGLKDQILALRWIKRNIQLFGGDSNKILLLGQSAGAASVHLHLLREETENLVSVAASISGTALNPWFIDKNPKENTETLAGNLNCKLNGVEMKSCLQAQPIEKLHAAVLKMSTFLDNPFNLFGAVVESSDLPDVFITEEPQILMKKGKIAKVPWMVTFVTEEGAYNAASLLEKNEMGVDFIEQLNDRWLELAPYLLFYNSEQCNQRKLMLSESLRQMYMGKERFSRASYHRLQSMYSDVLFMDGILKAIKLHRMYGKSPVYGYIYSNTHSYGIGNFLAKDLEFQFGAAHGDDEALFLPLSYGTNYTRSTNYTRGINYIKIGKLFVKMFEFFASERVPKFKGTYLPENGNTRKPMQFLQIHKQKYCVGPWEVSLENQCQETTCFNY